MKELYAFQSACNRSGAPAINLYSKAGGQSLYKIHQHDLPFSLNAGIPEEAHTALACMLLDFGIFPPLHPCLQDVSHLSIAGYVRWYG